MVSLISTPADDHQVFTGWSGDEDCSDGVVTMNQNLTCTASFELDRHTLTLYTAGSGSGAVSADGLEVPSGTALSYVHATRVTLTATADAGSNFQGWSGDCSRSGANSPTGVTMDADKVCTANFTAFLSWVTGGGKIDYEGGRPNDRKPEWTFGGVVGYLDSGEYAGQFQLTYHPQDGGAEPRHYVYRPEFTGVGSLSVEQFSYIDGQSGDLAKVTFAVMPKDMDSEALAAMMADRTWDPMDLIQISIWDTGKGKGKKDNPDSIEISVLGMVPLLDDDEQPVLDDEGKVVEVLGFKPLESLDDGELDGGNFTIHRNE